MESRPVAHGEVISNAGPAIKVVSNRPRGSSKAGRVGWMVMYDRENGDGG